MNQRRIVAALFFLSGLTGLVYEVVWIRMLALSFGSTAQALSTAAAVYLGGLAIGSSLTGRWIANGSSRGLRFYGLAEVLTGLYALAIPFLIDASIPLLRSFYAGGTDVTSIRVLLVAAILTPATIFMGATLPLLAGWLSSASPAHAQPEMGRFYALNLLGATAGAVLSGFVLLPALGFWRTLLTACAANVAIGAVAMLQPAAANAETLAASAKSVERREPGLEMWAMLAFLSGFLFMLYEVVWARVAGLVFGPTASTVTLTLGVFLGGLAIAALLARRVRRDADTWLLAALAASLAGVAWAYIATGFGPRLFGAWVREHADQPQQIEWMKLAALAIAALPLATAAGLLFPLLLRAFPRSEPAYARYVGRLYGINTVGCIAGSLLAGWMLIPALGTQGTIAAGAAVSVAAGSWLLLRRRTERNTAFAAGAAVLAAFAYLTLPRWDLEALTAGAYKYAPYANGQRPPGELAYLSEGTSGTVVVRKSGGSTILAIDGKVDATDTGGDLLTEKLLAHIPLMLAAGQKTVCLIGLASGVTAGAALSYPVESLDVLEVSPEVVDASHHFDHANGRPLEDRRTRLMVNDGRNHLLLGSRQYDVIVSEPSNPWIAGMNNLFTRDFFRIAKQRLTPGGLFAQWFHIYNMPGDDLRSLLRAFHEVFPSAALWRLNDGDVLLIGMERALEWPAAPPVLPDSALADLRSVGLDQPGLLWSMYTMRDADLGRFAANAPPNTDDRPWLEFHGQRNLHAQTDSRNADELEAFEKTAPDPPLVAEARQSQDAAQLLSRAKLFEHFESYRSAFRHYAAAFRLDSQSMDALAGMDRCARQPAERQAVALALGLPPSRSGTLQVRMEHALERARNGDLQKARFLFAESAAAFPNDPAASYNFGVFSLEQNDFPRAIELFERAIALDPRNVPAHEAIAEAHLKLHDYTGAEKWSRRILALNPNHAVARQIVETIARATRN